MSIAAIDEFIDAGRTAFERSSGEEAIVQLGFAEVLDDLGDQTSLQMAMATFQAQGSALGDSSALARLLGHGVSSHIGALVTATVDLGSGRSQDLQHVLVGPPVTGLVAVDGPNGEIKVFAHDRVTLAAMAVPGRLTLNRVTSTDGSPLTVIAATEAVGLRRRGERLGRIALAFEILGAARTAVDLGVQHAKQREQFNRPIAKFQAVQHLLSWATTDCEAIEALARLTVTAGDQAQIDVGDTDLAGAAKAIAGRNGLKACERSMQVLGGIGFTAEHEHHHFHSRVLILDSLLGSHTTLARSIGRAWRSNGRDRAIPASVLAAAYCGSDGELAVR